MSNNNHSNRFVDLHRTFHELAKYARESDDFDLTQAFFVGPSLDWDDLIANYRTVILSEAGTGKTEELRQVALRLKGEGKRAFFLRLEHIPDDFEDAFEEGSFEEFQDWLASTDEAWLLLDSVDEARLRNPGDFERAVRKLGRRVQSALDRAHIVLSGRTSAWRPKTDLEISDRQLPGALNTKRVRTTPTGEASNIDDDDFDLDIETVPVDSNANAGQPTAFQIVALDDLDSPKIETFIRARGITDTKAFLEEIERADAESFTTRPQDLEELVEFWTKEQRIGTRLELMQNSIRRRLEERDQNHRDAQPLAAARAREGARLVAAASVLGREATIQVPDGAHNNKGIPVQAVLPDWDDVDQNTLLSRPIFDEAIYGTVRFHHRSVREFLTAEWLAGLLTKSTSRREIEGLLFRTQYGVEVIVPTLRPVLPWLAIMDDRIRERVRKIAPEVLFEGGDPSALPLATRQAILSEVCDQLAAGKSGRSALDYSAVQRFASPDLVEDIRRLLGKHAANPELVSFLVRMVWLGRLKDLKTEVKAIALSPKTPRYTRTAAIRALSAVAKEEDFEDLRTSFAGEAAEVDREWLHEIISVTKPTAASLKWLLKVLEKVGTKERYNVDSLSDTLASFVSSAPEALLAGVAEGLNKLLELPPFIERRYCEVSKKNGWMTKAAAIAAERLIKLKSPEALKEPTLAIIHKVKSIRQWDDDLRDVKTNFSALVPAWPELNRTTFWYDVAVERARLERTPGGRLTGYWQASVFGASWEFGVDDFDYTADLIVTSSSQDDKLVALSLAFDIYAKGNRPPMWRDRLLGLAKGNDELEERLKGLLNPPVSEHDREEKKWRKRAATQEKREKDGHAKSKAFILSHVELVRAPQLDKPTDISSAQWYLHERLREKRDTSSKWTVGRWRELIPEYGEEVAQAYRDGAMNYWRRYRPALRSEGAPDNSVPIFVIFGLAGLGIEAAETPDWARNLSRDDVLLACRYAAHELNGFPAWFPALYEAHPEIVGAFLVDEVEKEIASAEPDKESHYLLSDVSWSGKFAWDRVAPDLLRMLRKYDVTNAFNLNKLLTIVQGSLAVSDADLADLAKTKAQAALPTKIAAIWHAVWIGVEPGPAIEATKAHLAALKDVAEQTSFAMTLVTSLWAGRRGDGSEVRRNFLVPAHLKDLFLLTQTYASEKDDIDRASGEAYSPGLRDNAQEARNTLFDQVRRIPGKEAYIALEEIANMHPNAASKPWLAEHAYNKAEQDADMAPWSPAEVRDFHEHLDRTPKNHRELADLAIMRLRDLKDDIENGDDSVAKLLMKVTLETEMRNYLAHELREKAHGRYTITQEEELADDKRPDLRFHGAGFDAPVPCELKLAEKWTGPKLFERLENQLSGDYLRDNRSAHGILALVNRDAATRWQLPSGAKVDFDGLIAAIQAHWESIANLHPHVESITVIGIDITKRFK